MNRSALVLLAVALAACAEDAPPPPPEAPNAEPAWAEGEAWSISPVPLLVVAPGDGDRGFERVADVALLPGGGVAVADGAAGRVRMWDAQGEETGSYGGGDAFGVLGAVGPYRADSVYAVDLQSGEVSILGRDGSLGRTFTLPSAGVLREPPLPLPNGRFLVVGRAPRAMGETGSGVSQVDVRPLVVGAGGTVLDTFPELPLEYDGFSEAGRPTMVLLAPRANVGTAGDRVFWGWPDRFEVRVLTSGGEVMGTLSRPHQAAAVTAESRARYIDSTVAASGGALPREALESALFGSREPAFAVAGYRIQGDDEGHVWVPAFTSGRTPPATWSVFDEDGRWLGDVPGPAGLRIVDIESDRVAGVSDAPGGGTVVQVHSLVRP